MEYNSQKDNLIISEYGRNVQNMIFKIRDMEDGAKRQKLAEAVIELMYQMNPADRNNPDYKEKLWGHLFRIADYKLDVTLPEGIDASEEKARLKPQNIVYSSNLRKNRHYGRMVQELIPMAIAVEDEEKKEEFVMIIAAYMKMAHRTWSREHFVSDDVIKQDLLKMSDGKLVIAEETTIEVTAPMPRNNNNHHRNKNKGGRHQRNNNNRGRNQRNNNNRGRRR